MDEEGVVVEIKNKVPAADNAKTRLQEFVVMLTSV